MNPKLKSGNAVMSSEQRAAWNKRPMVVTVKDCCPRCNKLVEGVQKRVIFSGFGTKIEETCCTPCAEAIREEYNGVTYC